MWDRKLAVEGMKVAEAMKGVIKAKTLGLGRRGEHQDGSIKASMKLNLMTFFQILPLGSHRDVGSYETYIFSMFCYIKMGSFNGILAWCRDVLPAMR